MSTLGDAVREAYSEAYLKQITNPGNPGSAASGVVNVTQLERAVVRAQSMFKRITEVVFDSTDADHMEIAILMVEAKLLAWGAAGTDQANAVHDRAVEAGKMFRATGGGRPRIAPSTNSEVTPSDENKTGGTLRPWADDEFFSDMHMPRSGEIPGSLDE